MQLAEILNELKQFIANELLDGQDAGLDATTPLLEWGVIDSLAMVSLLSFIEKRFHISVPDEEVRPRNFENLQALADLLVGLMQTPEAETKEKVEKVQTGTMVQVLASYGIRPELVELPGSEQHLLRVSGRRPPWILLPPLGNPSTSWGGVMRQLVDEQEIVAVD